MALLPVLAQSSGPYAHALRFILWTLGAARGSQPGTVACHQPGRGDLDHRRHQEHAAACGAAAPAGSFLAGIKPTGAAPGALVFGNGARNPLANWDREAKAIMAASRTECWTLDGRGQAQDP